MTTNLDTNTNDIYTTPTFRNSGMGGLVSFTAKLFDLDESETELLWSLCENAFVTGRLDGIHAGIKCSTTPVPTTGHERSAFVDSLKDMTNSQKEVA